MDLVSRLRRYIDHIAMPVTQFADLCAIPRPTMSQLLGGRNKKVSNELITKIHDAFPNLNILWLMFGQGDMLVKENIVLSEPQNRPPDTLPEEQTVDDKKVDGLIFGYDEPMDSGADNSASDDMALDGASDVLAGVADSFESAVHDEDQAPYYSPCPPSRKQSGGIASLGKRKVTDESSRRIVNIIVYYSDNSFEAFVPERP